MRRETDDVPDTGGHDGYERLTDSPRMKDGRRSGLLSGMVDGFLRLPVGFRLFVALLAFMAVFAMLLA